MLLQRARRQAFAERFGEGRDEKRRDVQPAGRRRGMWRSNATGRTNCRWWPYFRCRA